SSSLRPRFMLAEPVDPAETLKGTPIIVARFDDGDAFLHGYRDLEPAGEIAVVTRAQPEDESVVVLEIFWDDLPNPVFARARVWRRRLGLVARLHADSQAARDFLLQM